MDMRLYRMELYKLLYKKIFRFGLLAVLGILLAYFLLVSVGGERLDCDDSISGVFGGTPDKNVNSSFFVFCSAAQAIFWPAGRPCSWL